MNVTPPQQDNSQTRVKDLMTHDLEIISPDATLQDAAQMMESVDCGVLPVGTHDKLEGMITDRDIVIRAVATGKDVSKTKVRDCMSVGVCACNESDTADVAAQKMRDNHVNRLVVENEQGKPCGILSFGRILRKDDNMAEVSSVIASATGRKVA